MSIAVVKRPIVHRQHVSSVQRLRMSQSTKTNSETETALKLFSVCVLVPHPEKRHRNGEDGAFITNHAVGVFDGVGSWSRMRIDAGLYAKQLAQNSEKLMERETTKGAQLSAKKVLTDAVERSNRPGTSTAILAVLNGARLNVCNLGDCMGIVVRDGRQIFSTQTQQHAFNMPYQVGFQQRADLLHAKESSVTVENYDIIVMASDGLWDNLPKRTVIWVVTEHLRLWKSSKNGVESPSELEKLALSRDEHKNIVSGESMLSQSRLKAMAFDIAARACKAAQDVNSMSPFAENARRVGRNIKGGKLDDITVIVSAVLRSESEYHSMYFTKCNKRT